MTLIKQFGTVAAAAFLLVAVQAWAVDGTGEKLYKDSCMSCHKEKPAKMMGKPVDGLVAAMNKYKTMACPTGKVATMQEALKPMSEQNFKDIATYLNGLK